MPLPSELVTPPVTKTYFGMGLEFLRGFSDSSIAEPQAGTASAGAARMEWRLMRLAADWRVRRLVLIAACLALAACKQGGGGY